MTGLEVVSLLSAVVAPMLVYIIARREQSRKDKIEPTSIIVDTAVKLVEPLRVQVTSLSERVTILERKAADQRRILHHHAEWDTAVMALAVKNQWVIPPPPPLFLLGDEY